MAKYRKVQLEGDVVEMLFRIYREHGHPYGKNARKRKKWISRYCERALRRLLDEEEKLDNAA